MGCYLALFNYSGYRKGVDLMGYIEIHKPDGTIIYLGEPQPMHTERIETCDICNEPKPESDLIKIKLGTGEEQKLGIDDAVWKCSKCHGAMLIS